MAAVLKIRPIGNSACVILPKEELDRLQVAVGDELAMIQSENGFELSPHNEGFASRVRAFERSLGKYRNAYRELAK